MTADGEPPAPAYSRGERRVIARYPSPPAVQTWLRSLPYNWERRGQTLRTLRGVLRHRRAHCLEAAISAAAILEPHGHPPLLLDLESQDGLDHVLWLWRQNGFWGTVARSRDPGLHGRRPVFRTLKQLVDSYAPAYVDHTGRIVGYGVYDLRDATRDWRTAPGDGNWWIEKALIDNDHTRYHMPHTEYEKWRRKYDRFKRGDPRGKPVYYPGRKAWLP